MKKTTITITINHELDDQVLHPAHQLVHNALYNFSMHDRIDYQIFAVNETENQEKRVIFLNPAKPIAGGLKLNEQ